MIGINFIGFIILLVISIVISAIMHFGFKFYVTAGIGSFLSKVVIGWIGAWLGSPIFGYWFGSVSYNGVYFIPAILGCFALLIIVVDGTKTFKSS